LKAWQESRLENSGQNTENFSLDVRLSVRLSDFELEGVRIRLEKGEYLALLGPTGSGKSVLLEAIAGFYPCSGKIILNGRDITKLPPERRKVGVVYQDFVLFPRMSVYDNIAYGLRRRREDVRREVAEVAELMHIEHLLERKPATLSGGEKQRVAIARALVTKPELLLMDEPFSALDPVTREELRGLVRKVVRELDVTVIHATHDLDDVFSLADSVCVLMRNGKKSEIVQQGSVEEVFSYPVKEVAKLCGINYLIGYARKTEKLGNSEIERFGGELVEVELGSLRMIGKARKAFEGEAAVCIRPELFRVLPYSHHSYDPYGCTNSIECEVLEVCRSSRLVWIKARAGEVIFRCCVTPSLSVGWNGEKLRLEVEPENVCVYPLGGDASA